MGISLATAPSSTSSSASAPAASASSSAKTISTQAEEYRAPAKPQLVLALRKGNKPVPGQVYLRGPNPQQLSIFTHASPLSIPEGPQLLEIAPEEGLAKLLNVDLAPGQKQTLTLDIESEPAEPAVRLLNQRILFAEPLAFALNKAELTLRGEAQLRALADLLVRNHIQTIRIESHVEAQKTQALAVQLSAERSKAVVEALAKLGIEEKRLEVLNWGDAKPVAPNTIRKGRLLNRRMDFVVVDRWD
jgi:outer membrane protein OmpA-like peptidoglycan-associated protein